ncbi:MAG: hypothetical protein CMP23_12130 [Rickettsiales bacterium]|nr:hypothetical protein [Rickettsiales bacterium]
MTEAVPSAQESSLRLIRVVCLYHLMGGAVLALFPADLYAFLELEPPRYWLLHYILAAAALLAGAFLHLARSAPRLRAGLLLAVILGNLVLGALLAFFVAWSQLPMLLFGPALASGLLAWLLWGLDDREEAQ